MMFRASQLKVHILKPVARFRAMSLSRKFLNADQSFDQRKVSSNVSATAKLAGNATKKKSTKSSGNDSETPSRWPQKIFSGIQPTGSLHLGNYLGAVRSWTNLQNASEDVTICIVDMHSITMPHNPPKLRENIFEMAATLLACGIDPEKSTLFVQSAVLEHSELNWILSSLTTMPRLGQLPQFKEKSRTLRDVPLGLYVYPVLQAADIMLYKATHVPVGIDQLQHIQLAQHLARGFNTRYGELFPVCHPMIGEVETSRVLSLRDPTKKMSKSESNPKATIYIKDSPSVILEKIKKAVTDFTSDISYHPQQRPGVSNLVNIHAQVTNQSIESIVAESKKLDTAKYKEVVAEAVIEHLRPIREQIDEHLSKRNELIYMLEIGAEKARQCAQQTMAEVKQRLGLGTYINVPAPVQLAPLLPEHSKITASQRLAKNVLLPNVNAHSQAHYEQRSEVASSAGEAPTSEATNAEASKAKPFIRRPIVPYQNLRVEMSRRQRRTAPAFKMDTTNTPPIGFRAPPVMPSMSNIISSMDRTTIQTGAEFASAPSANVTSVTSSNFMHGGGKMNNFPGAVASVTSSVNAANKKKELASTLATSAFYSAAMSAGSISHVKPNPSSKSSGSISSNSNSSSNVVDNKQSDEDEYAYEEEDEEQEDETGSIKTEVKTIEN